MKQNSSCQIWFQFFQLPEITERQEPTESIADNDWQEFDAVEGADRAEHLRSEKRVEERDGDVMDVSEMRFCYVYGQCQVKCIDR